VRAIRLVGMDLLALIGLATAVHAQNTADFDKGRDVFMETGYSPDGTYLHLGSYIHKCDARK
jgi:hypothetical protein